MTTIPAQRLATVFVDIADTLIDDFDLIEFLEMVATRAAEMVNASAAGLVLADQHGSLEFMAGSDENVKLVELFQLQNREGPCLDAFNTGRPIVNVDLHQAGHRWPKYAPRAVSAGFHSVHAFPLRLRNQVIGALNVFGDASGKVVAESDVPVLQALADVAAIGLLQERAIHRGEILVEQLQGALNSRVVIEQAKGAVAQATGVHVDEAFSVIRGYARRHGRKLTDVAQAVVTDPTALADVLRT